MNKKNNYINDYYVDESGNIPNPGLMVFPTWRTNSIVYSQQMVSKIPIAQNQMFFLTI